MPELPGSSKLWMASPRTVTAAWTRRPAPVGEPVTADPSIATISPSSHDVKPVWVVPSMTIGVVRIGRAVASAMVCGPVPGISKSIVSVPAAPLAASIAARMLPAHRLPWL